MIQNSVTNTSNSAKVCKVLVNIRDIYRSNELINKAAIFLQVDGPHDDKLAVDLIDASFSWSKELPPVLSNVNISVGKGEMIVVVGSVGSGKSSLLNRFVFAFY